jgi:sedoheptulokinase
MIVLGIDLGTTKVASVLVDTERSIVLDIESRDHNAGLLAANPWEHHQDPNVILTVARELIATSIVLAGKQSQAIEGLCVSGQMHGILYVDRDGSALSPLFTWLDARGAQSHPAGNSYSQVLSSLSGRRLSPGFGSVTHFYNHERGLVPRGATALCSLLDFVTMRLCDLTTPVSDSTTAASLGLFDIERNTFELSGLDEAGFASISFPTVAPAGTRIGTFDGVLPVFAPIADNQAGFIGAVSDPLGAVLVNVGTSGQVSIYSPDSKPRAPSIDVRPFPGNGYLHVGAALCSGKAYERLRDFLREVVSSFGGDPQAVDYETMNRLAADANIDPEAGLEVDTRFAGTRVDPGIRGAVKNISLDNFTPSNLVRGVLDGIAAELFSFYADMAPATGFLQSEGGASAAAGGGPAANPLRVIGSGNAMRRNPALRRAVARRFGRPVKLPRLEEEAALGAALCAAVGAGFYPDYQSAGRLIRYREDETSS